MLIKKKNGVQCRFVWTSVSDDWNTYFFLIHYSFSAFSNNHIRWYVKMWTNILVKKIYIGKISSQVFNYMSNSFTCRYIFNLSVVNSVNRRFCQYAIVLSQCIRSRKAKAQARIRTYVDRCGIHTCYHWVNISSQMKLNNILTT